LCSFGVVNFIYVCQQILSFPVFNFLFLLQLPTFKSIKRLILGTFFLCLFTVEEQAKEKKINEAF
jgi:ssRNA-specific RNase YbeY (16S rRNA maturation enzyme)